VTDEPRQLAPDEPPSHIDPPDWQGLLNLLLQGQWSGWIFRGQARYDWTLKSGLARLIDPAADSRPVENSAIGFFIDRAAGLLSDVPDEHDLLGWLAMMQHYGAPTRLLDWTHSPFVALYFAYEESRGSDGALYLLNSYLCRRTFVGALFPTPWDHLGVEAYSGVDDAGQATRRYLSREQYRRDRENALVRFAIESQAGWPLPVIPFRQDARMAAQQTIFTVAGDLGNSVDTLFNKDNWPERRVQPGNFIAGSDSTIWPLEYPGHVLRKIRLRNSWRSEALLALAAMGITGASLFPGLDGLGRATRHHAEAGRLGTRDVLNGWLLP
jgi:FRG domain